MYNRLKKSIVKICENPEMGKPLKYELKVTRRIHLNPHVLIYSIEKDAVVFHYIEHHDNAY